MLGLVARQRALNAASARLSVASSQRCRALHSSRSLQALQKFAMPAMSPTMTEGGIATWKKAEGDKFAPGDVLLEIETDKATMDVEAQDDGVLAKIIVQDGAKNVQVGSTIAITAEDADEINDADVAKAAKDAESEPSPSNEGKEESSAPPKKEEEESAAPEQKKEESASKKEEQASKEPKKDAQASSSSGPEKRDVIFASPVAKRMALDKGIPLSQVKGTGPNGRIIKTDIENFKGAAGGGPSASSSSGPLPPSTKLPPGSPPAKDLAVPQNYEDVPASNMRKIIATRLLESKQNVPHYYLTAEINMERVNKLREVFNSAASSSDKGSKDGVKAGTKLSVNDFIVKACAIALQDVPEANSAWMGDFIRQYKTADIAIAVATPAGLITPIVTNVGAKGLASISAEVKSLAAKARDNKLKPHEYQGGTFSISNLGMFGIQQFQAIINPPSALEDVRQQLDGTVETMPTGVLRHTNETTPLPVLERTDDMQETANEVQTCRVSFEASDLRSTERAETEYEERKMQ